MHFIANLTRNCVATVLFIFCFVRNIYAKKSDKTNVKIIMKCSFSLIVVSF
ncbi:hypothetical protein D3C80_1069520 [compost metagenome]